MKRTTTRTQGPTPKKQLWIEYPVWQRMDLRVHALRASGKRCTLGEFASAAIDEKLKREKTPKPIEEVA